MVKDEQVRKLRKKRMQGKTLSVAAMAAGMCERTARKWVAARRGALGGEGAAGMADAA